MGAWLTATHRNVAELFKTPGKLRGKTPRTTRKAEPGSVRVVRPQREDGGTPRLLTDFPQPLSDVFSTTPKGAPNPFAIPSLAQLRSPKILVAEDKPEPPVARLEDTAKPPVVHPPHAVEPRAHISLADSGYHGSQSQDIGNYDRFDKDVDMEDRPQRGAEEVDLVFSPPRALAEQPSPSIASPKGFQSPNESQTRQITAHATAATPSSAIVQPSSPFASRTRLPIMSPRSSSPQKMSSPARHSPQKPSCSPQKSRPASPPKGFSNLPESLPDAGDRHADDGLDADDAKSLSDASSPIRPIVRKSSLNFASLPAREPLTAKKSIGGARVSRTSHLDFSRPSYFNRHTGGKSLGNAFRPESEDDDDQDEMDVDDEDEVAVERENTDSQTAAHSKTETQRLQDQISMLGKPQATGPRPSKSLANFLPSQQSAPASRSQSQTEAVLDATTSLSPKPTPSVAGPGAFPDDDTDDWIAPPPDAAIPTSPKPAAEKLYGADLAGDLAGKETMRSPEFALPKSRSDSPEIALPKSRPGSPVKTPFSPTRPAVAVSHGKSVSVPTLPTTSQLNLRLEDAALKKTISVSNPALTSVAENDLASPPKSPTRSFRENPLNKLREKVSSMFKHKKPIVSSATISAQSKFSFLQSPSTAKLGYHPGPSVESFKAADTVVYPDLSRQVSAITAASLSPVRTNSVRKTRQSTEREKLEAKERQREDKEQKRELKDAKRAAEKFQELEKIREKEAEKARVFSREQEKLAAMEKKVAAQKEQDRAAQTQAQPPPPQDFRTPGPRPRSALKSPFKTTRPTPRKTREQAEEDVKKHAAHSDEIDLDMADVPSVAPPQSIPRPTTASSMRIKRPMKPTKETAAKPKQAPTVIRVNTTGSQLTQFHPSNSGLGAAHQETSGPVPVRQLNGKASQGSLNTKPSSQNFGGSVSSSGRPKALDLAARKKEKDEREAQQKRDAKLEAPRKRAAQEEERRQKEDEQREAQAKRAAIEKAKQTKAPPPAVRSQPNGPPEYSSGERAIRPPSRLGSTMHQERPVKAVLSNPAKGPAKRPLPQDAGEESSRSQQKRPLPSQQPKEAKRMRWSEEFDEDIDMMDSHNQRTIKGAPVRPSAGFRKDPPTKSMYGNGYTNAPPPSASQNLFKATVTGQHNTQAKTGHPLDMAQFSKGQIPFAASGNPAHKTPARPVGGGAPKSAKSANRSSPRFQNGETIELPDIETDEDSDDDDGNDGHMTVADWANSPALKAALLAQEQVDPMQVFGPSAPLNMEEVFSKTRDRFPKFRARTSSANWSGTDKLTSEDIRKDLAARDKMRREGGWTYEMSREMS
ncbi:hypothetical protein BT67DRAFT_445592 [Trichocladium antarcticum]|uniref:Inner centromere protein ARK-binding domain-containing protein n=1 Tax=Trichocladium antarcticum TaxID=1450529 RepID=A0AAN6UCK3_9PEZI|nr:hypothetical protein BT67DRAFT_445592 [Trichocladium antarcticum]